MMKESILRVGFGRADITPLEPTMLGGCGGVEGFQNTILDMFKEIKEEQS